MEMSDYDKDNIPEILAGHGDWYAAYLIRLIGKADGNNLRKLARVYPDEVQAVLESLGDRRGEVFKSLSETYLCSDCMKPVRNGTQCPEYYKQGQHYESSS